MSEESPVDDSSYVAWKGWVEEVPFGTLDAGERQYFDAELRKVVRNRPPISDVLEIGYGNGSFLAYGREKGWKVVGIELEQELVEAGTRAGYRVFRSDQQQAIENESYDLVVLFDVLEHIPQDDIVGFLSGLAGSLRPGGRILMRFPNADSWLGNPLQNGDPTHVTAIGYLKMTYFAVQASLRIVSFTGARRHGFKTSLLHGIYGLTAGPLVRLHASIMQILYFPLLPVVLWTSNVVCVVERTDDSTSPPPKRASI